MSASKTRARRARGILEDHKKYGKKLKSSIASLDKVRHTSYIDEVIPEILHIAMAFRAYGYYDGMRLCESLFKIIGPYNDRSSMPFASNLVVDESHREAVIHELNQAGVLEGVRTINAPLSIIEEWPLGYLGASVISPEDAVAKMEDCVGSVLDKSKTAACAAMATLIYWQGVSGKLHFAQGMPLPDLNSIVQNPDSEAAKLASSFVRATIMAFWGMSDDVTESIGSWSPIFWQRAIRLSNCYALEPEGMEP